MSTGSHQWSGERIFFAAALVLALVMGTGLCFLLVAVNKHEAVQSKTIDSADIVPILPDHARQLVDFSLTDRTDRTITRAELAGKILVVDFLFTSCSLTCPVVNKHMAEVQQLTTNQPDVKLVSLTVDPRSDTVDVLAEYGQKFGADTNRWLLLTGDKTQLHELIATSFLNPDLDDPFTYMPGNFSHTDRIAVVDAQGRVQAYFDGLNENVAAAIVAEIARLRK
ncbi:MAG TPA: SCO family protein [Verrucomicrobiae bacterium]